MGKGRKRDPRVDQAKELYEKGWKLADIAREYGIPPGTVRRWKYENGWDDGAEKSERSEKKSERSENDIEKKKELIKHDIAQVIDNPELTDKQRLFCLYYIRYFNATKAYLRAYDCSYETAMVNGCELLRNTKIQFAIKELKRNRFSRELLTAEDIFQKYMDIAFSDMTNYLSFREEEVQVMGAFGPVYVKDADGQEVPLMKKVNVVRLKDSELVDGTLISEVKQGKDGTSIKLADRMKALAWLAEHMDIATEEQKARIALLKKQAEGNLVDEQNTGVIVLAPVLEEEEDAERDMDSAEETDPHAAAT